GGVYYWVASNRGADNEKGEGPGCKDELVEVGQASPKISTTQLPAAGTVGATFKDKANLTGLLGEHPGGTVSFKLFDNPKCDGEPIATDGPHSVTSDNEYESPHGAVINPHGTYSWLHYSIGDHINKGVVSSCNYALSLHDALPI